MLWGSRVVIPECARESVLQMLHNAHPGIVKMKAIARSYVWWPGMDKAVETYVSKCDQCQLIKNNMPPVQGNTWLSPGKPWIRLHIDFAGPFHGKIFMLIVDAYTKWLEVFQMSNCTAQAVITKLRNLFATHGLPQIIVSDNATVFTSNEYLSFLQNNGI